MNERDQQLSAAFVWGFARKILGKGAQSAQRLTEILSDVIDSAMVERFVSEFPPCAGEVSGRLDDTLERAYRKAHGVYFTPASLARQMASWIPDGSGTVVDPACGDGELLVAAATQGHRVWGIEQDRFAAIVAAVRLKALRADAWVICGDGLDPALWPADVKSTIANPPYVGEKGNKLLFDDLRERWPDLGSAFSPRMDLAYLFWWRVIERSPHAIVLASEYWLWADGAAKLRDEMGQRLPARWLFRLGAGQFSSAPGHHSMVAVCETTGVGCRFVEVMDLPMPAEVATKTSRAITVTKAGAEFEYTPAAGVALAELAKDSQGFVSGFDGKGTQQGFLTRLTPPSLHLRPVLRASDCVANRIFVSPQSDTGVVWVDGELGEPHEVRLHQWFGDVGRERLSNRREVKSGRMPWYRLHWPRRRAEMTQPKIVVPRRASQSLFCLDLSASMVSSDCTYLTAPTEVEEPVEYLMRLMWHLNSSAVREQFEARGKRKGDIYEFYAGPLRRLQVALVQSAGELDVELEVRLRDALDALLKGVDGYLDLK